MKKSLFVGLCSVVSILAGFQSAGLAADVSGYEVAKGQLYFQTGTNTPVLADTSSTPFEFEVQVQEATDEHLVTFAKVTTPKKVLLDLEDGGSYHFLSVADGTKAALDSVYPVGAYTFEFHSANDGTKKPVVTLGAEAFPAAPKIVNWNEVQNIDAASGATIQLQATNVSTNDFLFLEITDAEDATVYSSPLLFQFGVLSGTNTTLVIPPGVLNQDSFYKATVKYLKRTAIYTTNYAGATGIAGYYRKTAFNFTTLVAAPPAGRVQFSPAIYSVSEDAGAVNLTIARSDTNGEVSVILTTSDITASNEYDYVGYNTTVTLPDGVASTNFSIPILDDTRLEGPETFKVSLSSPTGEAVLGVASNAIVTILDNELTSSGVLQFSPKAVTITEAGPMVLLNVARTGGTVGAVNVNYATQDGSAVHGDDYISTNGILAFATGQASKTISVKILQDSIVDTNETFFVSLSSPTGGAALGSNTLATVTIKDDDLGGVLAFSSATYATNENAATAAITITRTGGKAGGVSVVLSTSNLTATASSDYVGTNVVVTFASNELTKTFYLQLIDDTAPESNETVALNLHNPTGGATLGKLTNAVLTILENESSLTFTNAAYTVGEQAGTVSINVVRAGGLSGTISVDYATENGTATTTNDYRGTNGTLTFGPNVTVKTITVPIMNDTLVEGSETFAVNLSNPQNGAQLGGTTTATVTITNDDVGGVITFSATNYPVTETAGKVAVMLKRTGGIASGVSVNLVLAGGTATAGADYTNVSGTVTFAAGEASKTINIPIINDSIDEPNETILLSLTNVQGGASIGSPANATVTIADDDVAGSISFSSATYSTNENAGSAVITVTRTGGKAAGASVAYATQNATAVSGSDYTATAGVLTFGSNELTKTFSVLINNDTNAEGNETLNLTLRTPGGGATLGVISNAVLTIVDDESSVSISNLTASVTEGSNVVITVVRAGALTTQVSVDIATIAGTATANVDFTTTTTTLVFPPNTSSKTFTVPALVDAANDGGETFSVRLSNPQGGVQLGTRTNVVVTIANAPDKNAVPLNGPVFIKGKIGGAAFTSLASACIASAASVSPFQITPSWTSGSGTGTIVNQMTIVVPRALGTLNFNNGSNTGVATYSKNTLTGSSHIYVIGDGSLGGGSYGTFTLDAIDYGVGLASGRFTLHMREVTGDVDGGFLDVTEGSFRVSLK